MDCRSTGEDQRKDLLVDPDARSWVPNRPMSSDVITRDEDLVHGTKIMFSAHQYCEGTGNASVLFEIQNQRV